MNKSESKYFHTALRMNEALISLLEKKDLEFITVKEICETAGVNRSTFYLHYETISDLMNETVEMVDKRFLSYFSQRERDALSEMNGADLKELVNLSITQTLTRSIYTSFTTFITIFVVFVMGVSSIREFALPIMVGIVCGAYSSVCITGALWYVLKTKVGKRAK